MRRMSLASLVLGMVFAAIAATGASAANRPSNGLEVNPAIAMRGTIPGRLVDETVTVVNLSREDYSVTGKITTATVDTNGRFGTAESGAPLPSAVPWATMQPASFLLPAGHSQNVLVSFTPPKGLAGGGYYAAVDFSGLSGSGVAADASHGALIDVAGSGVIRAPTIAKISAPAMSFGSTIPVTMRLENTGNDYAIAEGTLTVRDMFSNKSSTVDVPRTPIVPGTPRILTVDVPTPLMPGRLHVTARLTFGAGVPQDTATTAAYATGWWQLGVAIALLLLTLRFLIGIVRWRRRRRALKRERRAAEHETRTPVPVGANGGFADYAALEDRASAPAPRRAQPAVVDREPDEHAAFAPSAKAPDRQDHVSPSPAPHATTTHAPTDEELWPAPVVVPRAPAPPAEERPRPRLVFSRPADDPFAELANLAPPAAAEDDDDIDRSSAHDREPEVESETGTATGLLAAVVAALGDEDEVEEEPEPEPDPESVAMPAPASEPALTVVRPLPAEEPETPAFMPIAAGDSTAMAARAPAPSIAAAPVPAPAVPEDEFPAADRTARLSEQLLSSIDAAPAPGVEAAKRRARVAVEMLTTGKGKSAERLEVALKILRSSGADASAILSEAFDAEAAAGNDNAFAPIALALHQVAGGRAVEALLRAYAVAPRGQIVAVRTALKSYDADALGEYGDLLDALPADRRAALKPAKR